ncbi:beta-amyrin 24-hydroxylase [Corchorus olitorius]|uniref:Beta-amyrin 24-hydroxylase n=1 Tax=Corchorus olitorius TaxID=93759 RepID=A0A1R3FXZ0_9ROSI|nr:beta-amyrin 24-hydroxylase [Corchorus olitorius]
MGWQCEVEGEPALVRILAYATMNITIASIIQCIDLKVIASRHLLTETSLRIHKVIEGKNQSAEKRGHETLL